jgi:preprotein translocase subunit SecD
MHCSPFSLFPLIAALACSSSSERAKAVDWRQVPVSIEMRLAKGAAGPGMVRAPVYGQGKIIYVGAEPELSNAHIARVEAVKTRIGEGLILEVWLTKAGAKRIADLTSNHIGDSLAIVVNSVVLSVPVIRETIDPGTQRPSDIGVPLPAKEAGQLARAVSQTWPAVPAKGARRSP